jgi:hypothetical protein
MGEEKRPAWPGRMYARLEKKIDRPSLAGCNEFPVFSFFFFLFFFLKKKKTKFLAACIEIHAARISKTINSC